MSDAPGTDAVQAPTPRRRGRPADETLAQRRREQIIRAAYDVFASKGVTTATMSDVAKNAGVGQGTVYRYFPNQRVLLDGVFDHAVEEVFAQVLPFLRDAHPTSIDEYLDTLDTMSRLLFQFADERPEVLGLMLAQVAAIDEEFKERVLGLEAVIGRHVASFLDRGIDEGWVRDDIDPDLVGMLLFKLLIPGFVQELRRTSSAESRDRYRQTVTTFIRSAIAGETQ